MINLTDVWTVAWHEYRINVRRRGFILGTLLPPALILISTLVSVGLFVFVGQSMEETSGMQSGGGSKTASTAEKIGVVDQAHYFTSLPVEFDDEFTLFPDEDTAKQALLTDELRIYIVIPDNYLDTGAITIYHTEESSYVDFSGLRLLLTRGLLTGKVDEATITRIGSPIDLEYVELDPLGTPLPDSNTPLQALARTPFWELIKDPASQLMATATGLINLIFFLGLQLMLIFASGHYLFRSVSEEKESRIIEIVLSSISAGELLAGKVMGFTMLTLTQVGVWLLSSFILSGGIIAIIVVAVIILNPTSFLLGVLYCLLGYLIYAIIMATLSAGFTNLRESQSLLAIFLLIPMLLAYPSCFLFVLPGASNSLYARLLSFFPLTASIIMTIRLAVDIVPIIDIIGSIFILLVTNMFVLWAGVKVFRASLLMYGKRPTLKQIIHIVKTA